MRVSKAVRVGLSGTSLALAALGAVGCGDKEVATKDEQLKPRVHYVEQAIDQAAADAEREARRDDEEARRVALQEQQNQAPTNDPWFLRAPGGARNGADQPASTPRPEGTQPTSETPAIVIHEPPKPVQPVATPPQPVRRPPGWQIRAACGRG